MQNKIHYFYTKDYYKELLKRQIVDHKNGYFIKKEPSRKLGKNAKTVESILYGRKNI